MRVCFPFYFDQTTQIYLYIDIYLFIILCVTGQMQAAFRHTRHRKERKMTTTSQSIISRLTGLSIIVKISTHTALGQEWMLPVNIKANPYHCMRTSSNSGVCHTAWGERVPAKKATSRYTRVLELAHVYLTRSLHGTISRQTRSHPHAAYA